MAWFDPVRGGARRARIVFVLIGIAAATGAYATWLFGTQLGIGWYHDDGIYTIVAGAIADGRGPRLDFLPGAPYATKYPLLWPALLAVALAVTGASGPDLTGRVVVAPNALLIPLALLAYAALLHRSWRFPPVIVLLLLLALGINPGVLELARFPMSEIPYLALSLGAVALADASGDRPSRRIETAAAILAVAAMHTRIIGATLVLALLLAFAARKRWFGFLLTAILGTASVAGWLLYLRHAASVDAALHASPLLAYDLGYAGYASRGLERLLSPIVNAPRAAFFSAHIALGASLPMKFLRHAQTGASAIPLVLLVLGFLALLFAGLRARLACKAPRPRWARTETFYVPLYLAVLLLWPSSSWRLIVPLAPWLLALPVEAAASIPLRRARSPAPLIASGILLALMVSGLPHNLAPVPNHFMAGGLPIDALDLERALAAVRALPAWARVGSPMAPLVFLRTGREGVGSWVARGVAGPSLEGRRLRTFFVGDAEADQADTHRAIRSALEEYPRFGVGYALTRRVLLPDLFGAALAATPGSKLLFRSGGYELYALPAPASP